MKLNQEKKLDVVAIKNMNDFVTFALDDLGDSFCVTDENGEEISLQLENLIKE